MRDYYIFCFYFSGDEAKSAWIKLRNNHRDALRRQKRLRRSRVGATDIKPWKFQAQMEFLLRYMVNESRDTNFMDDVEDRSETPSEEEQHIEFESLHSDDPANNVENDEASVLPQNFNVDTDEDDTGNSPANYEPAIPPPSQSKKKVKKVDIDSLLKKTIEQREERAKQRKQGRKRLKERIAPKDDLYLFFMSMYEQTNKMPLQSQHVVRRNVFHTVSREQARLLNIFEPPLLTNNESQLRPSENRQGPNANNWLQINYSRNRLPSPCYNGRMASRETNPHSSSASASSSGQPSP
ncbi:uncharacterized protein LOC115879559 [Sitophilus oryzae]|uniref:Uncharacterized protein LOC115879559 n=1 Tax=Sitophilus oryzae TaxID=7048 RepID=A0A6J2XLC0_SITOR|nr:uncharacterized protein LOC115879559 [Sitophilus oryzae]